MSSNENAKGRLTSTSTTAAAEFPSTPMSSLADLDQAKASLRNALRSFPDWPKPGINFVDIMGLFLDPKAHATLLDALELQIKETFSAKPDVIVGLDARGFLFGPGLALRLGVSFVPVRKQGKLPGPCKTAEYVKEYGKDFFQMQDDAIRPGQKVLIVDDIIATGGSANAAVDLIQQLKGEVIGHLFILEIPGLNGRDKLVGAPTAILLEDA